MMGFDRSSPGTLASKSVNARRAPQDKKRNATAIAMAFLEIPGWENGLLWLGRVLAVPLLLAVTVAAVARIAALAVDRVRVADPHGPPAQLAAEARPERVQLRLACQPLRPVVG